MIRNDIYEDLVDKIVSLKLQPGEKISEIETSMYYHVSRTPIRDVFKKLEDNQLVDIITHSGTFVSKIDLDFILDQVFIKYSCELEAMNELSGKITDENLIYINQNIEKQKAIFDSYDLQSDDVAEKYFALDNDLHLYLFKLINRESVLKKLFDIQPNYQRYRFMTFYRDKVYLDNLIKIHTDLIKCLQNDNKNNLKKIIYEHNYSSLNGIKELVNLKRDYFINIKS